MKENRKFNIPNTFGMKAGDKKTNGDNKKFNTGSFKMKSGSGGINMDKFKMSGKDLKMKSGNLQMKRGNNPFGMQKDKPRFNIPTLKTMSLTKQTPEEPAEEEKQQAPTDKEYEEIYNKYDGRYDDLVSAHYEALKKLEKLEKIINDDK